MQQLLLLTNTLKTKNMERGKEELEVDFIGGAGPLTKGEENAIREFIHAGKERLG
jgi:hypothetical protein